MIASPRKRGCLPRETTTAVSGSRPRGELRHASLVSTTARPASTGWSGSIGPDPYRTAISGAGGQVEAHAELGVRVRGRRIDLLRAPGARRRRPQHARADQHGVGERPQQTHEEPVGVVVAGDHLVRVRQRRDRDDAVERRDEVRVHARLREARDRRRRSAQAPAAARRQAARPPRRGRRTAPRGDRSRGSSAAAAVRGAAGATRRAASARSARGRRPPPRPSPSARVG